MARYGFYFGDQSWFVKWPGELPEVLSDGTTPYSIDPNRLADVVHQNVTKQGIVIEYCCDGLIVFDFKKYPALATEEARKELGQRNPDTTLEPFEALSSFILKRTEVLNAYSLCLKASILAKLAFNVPAVGISPHNMIHMSNPDDPSKGVSFKSKSDSYQYSARYVSQYNSGIPAEFDSRNSHKSLIVGKDTLDDAMKRLEKCLEMEAEGALELCSLINFAICSLEDHDYPRCLVTCWVVIEAFLNRRWRTHLHHISTRKVGSKKKFINSHRMKKLTSNNYTASIITESLSLMGKLSFEEYQLIEEVRRARNKWMHELAKVPLEHAMSAVKTTSLLFNSEYEVELPTGTSLSL